MLCRVAHDELGVLQAGGELADSWREVTDLRSSQLLGSCKSVGLPANPGLSFRDGVLGRNLTKGLSCISATCRMMPHAPQTSCRIKKRQAANLRCRVFRITDLGRFPISALLEQKVRAGLITHRPLLEASICGVSRPAIFLSSAQLSM